MLIDADTLKGLIGRELKNLLDVRVTAHIRSLLVEPRAELRDWDYGEPGEQYPCWITFADNVSNIAIAYCESGFGPRNPWGLLWLESREYMSMGMDLSLAFHLLGRLFRFPCGHQASHLAGV